MSDINVNVVPTPTPVPLPTPPTPGPVPATGLNPEFVQKALDYALKGALLFAGIANPALVPALTAFDKFVTSDYFVKFLTDVLSLPDHLRAEALENMKAQLFAAANVA